MRKLGRVFELDTDVVLAQFQELLLRNGIDVREQAPAGVWWLHVDEDENELGRRATEMFGQVVGRNLREVEQ